MYDELIGLKAKDIGTKFKTNKRQGKMVQLLMPLMPLLIHKLDSYLVCN